MKDKQVLMVFTSVFKLNYYGLMNSLSDFQSEFEILNLAESALLKI